MARTVPARSAARVRLPLLLAVALAGCAGPHRAGSAAGPGPEPRVRAAPPPPHPAAARRADASTGPHEPAPRATAPASPAAAASRAPASALLVGTWLPAGPALAAADHRALAGDVSLEFRGDGTWAITGASYRASGTYRWLSGDEIELAIARSNLSSQAGTVSRRRVRVDATALTLTVEPRDGAGDGIVTRYLRRGR